MSCRIPDLGLPSIRLFDGWSLLRSQFDIDPQASIVIEGRVDKANVFVLEQYIQNDFSA
mgnify:CR=1 FL=1